MAASVALANSTQSTAANISQGLGVNPAIGDVPVVVGHASGSTVGGGGAFSCVDNRGGTYARVETAEKATGVDTAYVMVRDTPCSSALTHTVTMSWSGDTPTGYTMVVYLVTGLAAGGATAVRQAAKAENQAAGTPAVTFGAACLTGNPEIHYVACAQNPAAITTPSGVTEDYDNGYATPTQGGWAGHRDSGFTGTTVTCGSSVAGGQWAMVSVEFDASGGTTPVTPKTLATTYNVRAAVLKTLATTYNVRAAVLKTLATSWAVRTAVAVKTLATTWKVRSAVAVKTLATTWKVRASVTPKTLATTYNVRATATKTLLTSWAVRASVTPKSVSTTWSLRQALTRTLATSWRVRAAVARAIATTYAVRAAVEKAVATSWNVDEFGLQPVTPKTVATTYRVRQAVLRSLGTIWGVREVVGKSAATSWNVRQSVAPKALSTTWADRTSVTRETPTTWAVRHQVLLEVPTDWDVAAVVAAAVPTSWNVRVEVEPVDVELGTRLVLMTATVRVTLPTPAARV